MFDAVVLSTIGYVLIILSLFMHGYEHHAGKEKGCCHKGVALTLLGFILLLISVWVH